MNPRTLDLEASTLPRENRGRHLFELHLNAFQEYLNQLRFIYLTVFVLNQSDQLEQDSEGCILAVSQEVGKVEELIHHFLNTDTRDPFILCCSFRREMASVNIFSLNPLLNISWYYTALIWTKYVTSDRMLPICCIDFIIPDY